MVWKKDLLISENKSGVVVAVGLESDEVEIRFGRSANPSLSLMAATMSRFCSTGVSSSKRLSGTRNSERYQICLGKTVRVVSDTSRSGCACKALVNFKLFWGHYVLVHGRPMGAAVD